MYRRLLVLFVLVVPALAGRAQDVPLIERISFTERSDGLGLVVRLHAGGRLSGYGVPRRDGDDLTFTVFNAGLAPGFIQDDARAPVDGYAIRPDGGHLLVRLRLAPGTNVAAEAYRDRTSSDLLIGLTVAPPTGLPVVPVVSVVDTPSPGREAPAGPAPRRVEPGAPVDEAPSADRWRLDVVVIDAGHGGHDAGATANGVREKDVTLAVARRLGAYLEERLGVRVVYTRDDDRFITLRDRGRIANSEGGKLFVSIHANAAGSRAAFGTETYFLGMHKSDAARDVMERENEVVRLEADQAYYEAFDEEALIRQVLAGSAYMRKSEQLAGIVESEFAERVGRKSRGVKQAGFLVLWAASMPAILVELGFVTNPKEAAFLRSEQGQDYLASAIFRAVRAYKERYEQDLGVAE